MVVAAVVGALFLLSGERVTVPGVIGAPQAEAEVTLRNRGFDTDTVPKADRQEAGTVIAQDPAANEEVDEGATITLTVSTGPGEAIVPEVVGVGRRAARKALTDLGFRVKETELPSQDVGKDRVIMSSPDGGQRLERGEQVTLTVSSGPKSTRVPDVLRQGRDAASEALRAAGFKIAVREEERDDVDPQTVVGQDPAAGQQRARGSTVTITVASESSTVTVPDVRGKSEAEAAEVLARRDFEVRRRERATTDPDEDDQVLAQSPSSGEASRGATITITVGAFDDSEIVPGGPGTGATGPTRP